MLSSSPYPDPSAPNIDMLLENAQKWKESFNKPLPLGVKKAVSIVTCMDGRVMPASIFGLDLGDAEYIRNAGGRVTDDVIRSLVIAQELLNCKVILLIHHTDCGAQAAKKHHSWLVKKIKDKLGVDLSGYNFMGIGPSDADLAESVKEDVHKLRSSPLIPKQIPIYGFVYDVKDGSLKEVMRSAE
ncbi:probable carbon disulfide hydrolase [Coccomyxa sp. Obi]|nr:probable carbon disulfide hydrolase [Coccomyxa sp. Obi]